MKYDEEECEFVLNSGKRIYANMGILGLSALKEYSLTLFEGYDGNNGLCEDYTPEERKEIAEYMISLWKEWAK